MYVDASLVLGTHWIFKHERLPLMFPHHFELCSLTSSGRFLCLAATTQRKLFAYC